MVKLSSQSLLLSILLQSNWVDSFAVASIERHRRDQRSSSLVLFAAESNADDRLNDDQKDKEASFQELNNRVQKLQVEHTREQLEQAHTQSFLKRRPVKLPYNEARRWVQANLGAETKEEFLDLVANGNLRTPYIPKQPEEYYKRTREWISWDHFLRGCFDDRQPSEVQPSFGVFD